MQVITEGGGEETIVCVMKTSWLQRGGVFYFTVSHGGVGVWRNTTDRGVALPTEIGNDWSSLNDCDVERYQKAALLEAQKFFPGRARYSGWNYQRSAHRKAQEFQVRPL